MMKRIMPLCLALLMCLPLTAMAESADLSGMLACVFNLAKQEGIIGRWQILGMTGDDELGGALTSTMGEGGLVTLDITAETMTLTFIHPYAGVDVTSGAITHEENAIISGGVRILCELDGDEMRMVKPEGTMLLRRIAPTSPIGHWRLIGIDGDEEGQQLWAEFVRYGATVELILSDTHMSAILKFGEDERVEVGDVTIDEKTINTGLALPYTVEGDTLILLSGDVVMTFVRK